MTIRCLAALAVLIASAPAMAQTPPGPSALTSSISGIVKEKTTGAPLKDYRISTNVKTTGANGNSTTKTVSATTDEQGHYRLADLPPDQYNLRAQSPRGFTGSMSRLVTVAGGDLNSIDFNFTLTGTITGKVLDENKEPVPGLFVLLVSKEYYLGSVGYFLRGASTTNDQGIYSLSSVEAGHDFYLVTDIRRRNSPAHSEVPLNPKMRRPVPMRTWYPSSPDREGAAPLQLRSGEHREGVDIEVKKSPSYCVAGIASTPNGPGPLRVDIEGLQPSSGVSNGGGMFMATTGTTTGNDGEYRFCDLYPGSYRLTVAERNPGPDSTWAIATIDIADRDLADVNLSTVPGVSLDAEVVLEGPLPQTPVAIKPVIGLTPLLRTQMPGEKSTVRPDIPGTQTISGMLLDDYGIRATLTAPGLYIKDITYAGRSVRFEALHLGSAIAGTGLRVTVGQDGATLTAKVADKDGNPVADSTILVMPAGVTSEGDLAARIASGQTDQAGQYKSATLAPGKYFIVATSDSFDQTPESIGKLWQSHTRYQEVELGPSGTAQVNLQPVGIR